MGLWHQQNLQKQKHFAGQLIIYILLLLPLLGCGGTASTNGSTPTPRTTATSRPSLTPTPAQSTTVTPTPQPTQTATPSPCDTPPSVRPVSATEIAIGNTGTPRIALTFDAGGPADPAARILDILTKHHIHSTFFITGDWANQNPDLVRRIHSEGHEIANHTMHHPDLRTLSGQEVCTQLNQADQVISNLTKVTTRPYYRPPYGSRDTRIRSLAAQIGYRTVYWTIDTIDWDETNTTSDLITTRVMNNLKNGAIILMHAGSQIESKTLDGLMTKIEQRGYQMVTVTGVLE